MSIVLKQEDAKTKIVYMGERLKRNKMGMTIDNVLEILEKHKLHIPSNVFYELKADIVNFEEPFKPMVEIDLDYVIKQKYIEREVLDKIREQIKSYLRGVEITLEVLVESDPLRPKVEGAKDALEECLELIDKAETEADNGNDKQRMS